MKKQRFKQEAGIWGEKRGTGDSFYHMRSQHKGTSYESQGGGPSCDQVGTLILDFQLPELWVKDISCLQHRRKTRNMGKQGLEVRTMWGQAFVVDRNVKWSLELANRQVKRCPTSLIIREMQSKTTVRYHLILVRMAITKKSANKYQRGCREKRTLQHCWWENKQVQPLWRTVWGSSKN